MYGCFCPEPRIEPRPEGINPLEPELKPRPLRTREIVWDLFPTSAIIGWCVLVLIVDEHARPPHTDANDFTFVFMLLAFSVPLVNAIWMQLSGASLIRRITQPEWRESIWLSELKSRPYLLSQLKARAIIQSIPFAVGMVCCGLAVSCSLYNMTQKEWRPAEIFFGTGLIYALGSMQICGLCAGYLGHFDRIRWCCEGHSSAHALTLASCKWIVIILMTPFVIMLLGAFTAGFVEEFFVGSPDDPDAVILFNASGDVAFGAYCLFACTLLNLFFYHRLKISWKRTRDEFFKFE